MSHPDQLPAGIVDGAKLVPGEDGAMYLRWEPGLTTTTTTHTTTTVTHFPPVRLPLPPPPPSPSRSLAATSSFGVSLPTHLERSAFPLAGEPTPADLRVFALDVGGRKVVFAEEGEDHAAAAPAAQLSAAGADRVREGWERDGRGSGWTRVRPRSEDGDDDAHGGWAALDRVGLGAALTAFQRPASAAASRRPAHPQQQQQQQQQPAAAFPLAVTPPSPAHAPAPGSPPLALAPRPSAKGKERALPEFAFGQPPSPPGAGAQGYYAQQQRAASAGRSPPRKRQREAAPGGSPQIPPSAATGADPGGEMAVDVVPPSSGRTTSTAHGEDAPSESTTTTTTTVTRSYPDLAAAGQPPTSSVHQPSLGSGHELALLQSLPALLQSFDALPPKLADHFLLHCLRRSTLPTLQRVQAFISPALKFDFVAHLPPELAAAVFAFVPRAGLAAAARVSTRWNAMVDESRAVWVARLQDEGLWWGFGAEEDEEDKVRRRWEVRDRLDEAARRREREDGLPGTPKDDEGPSLRPLDEDAPGNTASTTTTNATATAGSGSGGGGSPSDSSAKKRRSHPLKHVYRIRHMTRQNWMRPKPAGSRFMFHGHGAHVVTCLQFDTDKIVSASDDHSINVYAIKDGAPRCRLDGHEGGVWALQYRGDVLVSGSTDRTVRVWSIAKGVQTHVFWGHTSTVRCLQIVEPVRQPNGEFLPPYPLVVTGSRDSTIRVWRLPGKDEPEFRAAGGRGSDTLRPHKSDDPVLPHENPFHNHCLEGHTNAVRAIAAHGRYCVSGSYDCTVRVWDIVRGTCLHVLRGHQQKVYSVVLDTRRGRVASGSMDGTVKVWDLVHGVCLATLEGHVSLVGLLGISPNHLVSAAADSTIKVWDASTLACRQTLAQHTGAITCFQHDETKIVSGSEGTLKMWDLRDGSFVRDIVTGVQGVWQVAFAGRYLVSASNRIGLTVFDVVDFGDCGYDDGAGDESLDALVVPEWERQLNRLEPRQYQEDVADDDAAMAAQDDAAVFSSPTAGGGSSTRRQRNTSNDLSSPEPDAPWTSHHPSVLAPPPQLSSAAASAGLSAGGTGASFPPTQPPITPQRSASQSTSVTQAAAVATATAAAAALASAHGASGHAQHPAAPALDDTHYYTPSGFPQQHAYGGNAPPQQPVATSNASPSVDRTPRQGVSFRSTPAGTSGPRVANSDRAKTLLERKASTLAAAAVRLGGGASGSTADRKPSSRRQSDQPARRQSPSPAPRMDDGEGGEGGQDEQDGDHPMSQDV